MGVKQVEYIVHGADRETGEERVEQFMAFSEVHARAIANEKGILVATAEPYADFKARIVEKSRAEEREKRVLEREQRLEQRATEKRTWRQRKDDFKLAKAARGEHVQIVQIDGMTGISLVIIIAIGVALGLGCSSCCLGVFGAGLLRDIVAASGESGNG